MPERMPSRLLVIDDDELFLEIARVNLERYGHQVEISSNPREGLNRAIETHFDLILLDLMMPHMRGEEVLRLLKPLGGRQRILVVSGHTEQAYRSRARDLGAVGYLVKPVGAQALCDAVHEVLDADPRGAAPDAHTHKPAIDMLAIWVFGVGAVTPIKRATAIGVVVGLCGIFCWLVWG